jgi:hypothetical protein
MITTATAPRRSRRASPDRRCSWSVGYLSVGYLSVGYLSVGYLSGVGLRLGYLSGVLLGCLLGCAPSPSRGPPAAPAQPSAPALQLGELTDYVPAAGLRWLIVGSPRHFAQQPALRRARERWLSEQRLQAFARATGIDLARTERALVAGFDLGMLYLVDGSGWVRPPEEPFEERLAGSAKVERPHPQLLRVSGLAGSVPEALLRIDGAAVAIAVGDPMLARIVEYRVRGRLERVVPALRGAALSRLPAELLTPGALRLYALGPFSNEAAFEAGKAGSFLLAGAEAIAAAVDLEGNVVKLRLAVAGAWDAEQDRERLLGLWSVVATGPLGHALALDQPSAAAAVNATPLLLTLEVALDAERLLTGLETVAAGKLDQLLAGERPAPP